jgi:high-affinity Fe2+/Pb2+ permease
VHDRNIGCRGSKKMTGHSRGGIWVLAVLAVLIAGHGIILYYASSHLALSVGFVSGVVLLIVIKHLGLLSPVYAVICRPRRIRNRRRSC